MCLTPYVGGEPVTQARSFSPGVVKGPRASVTASVALTTAGWAKRCPAYTGPPSLSLGMLDGEWGEVWSGRLLFQAVRAHPPSRAPVEIESGPERYLRLHGAVLHLRHTIYSAMNPRRSAISECLNYRLPLSSDASTRHHIPHPERFGNQKHPSKLSDIRDL
jgi:hypothetical protein